MQKKITKPGKLLHKNGELIQKGYAFHPILKYNRKDVSTKLRLKEWDYYLIYNNDNAVALTIGKSVSFLFISVSLIELNEKREKSQSAVRFIPLKKLDMPVSSETGDIVYRDKMIYAAFRHENTMRRLTIDMKNSDGRPDLLVSLTLTDEPQDSIVTATPFLERPTDFFYNQKIIGMRASGKVQIGNKTYIFLPKDSFGLLDWGRGVWPYETAWYWSAAQGIVSGKVFGFNLGYGFGNTSAATENMLFIGGNGNKLEDIVFHIPKNEYGQYEYMKPWQITSSDYRFEMEFTPLFDRHLSLSAVLVSTDQHQVFGTFSGTAILDNGTNIILKNFLGFAERVENMW